MLLRFWEILSIQLFSVIILKFKNSDFNWEMTGKILSQKKSKISDFWKGYTLKIGQFFDFFWLKIFSVISQLKSKFLNFKMIIEIFWIDKIFQNFKIQTSRGLIYTFWHLNRNRKFFEFWKFFKKIFGFRHQIWNWWFLYWFL